MLTLSGYQVHALVHEGKHSLLYRATRHQDQRPVFLKCLGGEFPSPAMRSRLKQEFELTKSLQDIQGVIDVYELRRHKNSYVIVLEDFGGESLSKNKEALPIETFLSLAVQIAESLQEVHHHHVIHKDINPSNIVWNASTGQLKLIDFGIATKLSREAPILHHGSYFEGTIAYIAPEQTGRMNRGLDHRADFYSLGATFYELLTQRWPFEMNDPLECIHAHIAKNPTPPHLLSPKIPKPLSAIVMKLMAKNAEDRYQSAQGLKVDLLRCREEWDKGQHVEDFPLGNDDTTTRFQLSQKLYGRESELQAIKSTFIRVCEGSTELLLISGFSGCGKSALVKELYRPLAERRAYFMVGKFEELKRDIPYASLLQAFQELVRQLLTEQESALARWRAVLLEALGPNGSVLTDVLPEIQLIIGTPKPAPVLPPQETQHRFHYVFRRFVRALASSQAPLVLFLDDLQWADAASLRLLQQLISDHDIQHLMLIGAYRDNEVDDSHPLILTLGEIEDKVGFLQTLHLGPLEHRHVVRLLHDTLHIPPDDTLHQLADLCVEKTGGNPFFLKQFLYNLHSEEMISFDLEQNAWTWDIASIRQQDITDNVISLMTRKLQRLPEAARQLLIQASCVGNRFDLHTLSWLLDQPPMKTTEQLWPLLEAGLLIPIEREQHIGDGTDDIQITYKFLHDQVQQAAYSLLDKKHRKALHHKLGRLLLAHTPEPKWRERIFDITNQLNAALDLIETQKEKQEVAKLNLIAGQKAIASAAYDSALQHLQLGLSLLPKEAWRDDNAFALSYHEAAAEAALLNGKFDVMEALLQEIFAHVEGALDLTRAHSIQIQAQTTQGRPMEAVRTALTALNALGVQLPEKPSLLGVGLGLLRTTMTLRRTSPEKLEALRTMETPQHLAAMQILSGSISAAHAAGSNVLPLMMFKTVTMSYLQGNSPLSSPAYASYGLVLCGALNNIDLGYRFGQLAMRLARKGDALKVAHRARCIYYSGIHVWKDSIHLILPEMLDVYQKGLEVGDLEYACNAIHIYGGYALILGHDLSQLEPELTKFEAASARFQQNSVNHMLAIHLQVVRNLLGQNESPEVLQGNAFETELRLPILEADRMQPCLYIYHLNQLILHTLFGSYNEGFVQAQKARKYIESATGTAWIPQLLFFESLCCASLLSTASSSSRVWKRRMKANLRKYKFWNKHAPSNFLHRYQFLQAELAQHQGQHQKAQQLFRLALQSAQAHNFVNDEALFHERIATYWRHQKQEAYQHIHLRKAHHRYELWGAVAKTQQLKEQYPQLIRHSKTEALNSRVATTSRSATRTTTSTGTDSRTLDLLSIIKASQTLSSQIMLEQLLTEIMRFVIENAGAQHGYLLLFRDDVWTLEAYGSIDQDSNEESVEVLQSQPLFGEEEGPERLRLATSIVQYVARTTRHVVLSNAAEDAGAFRRDPYIQKKQPISILCAPLRHQGQQLGILYLENNLTQDAFTPERLETLQVLASQAAISLENAHLYAHLEEEVAKRTKALQKALEELAQLNASKDKFFSIIAHDLRNPLYGLLLSTETMIDAIDILSKEKIVHITQNMYNTAFNLHRLLENLLEWSRLQRGMIEHNPALHDLYQDAHQVFELMAESATHKEIKLKLKIPQGTFVYADPNMLRTVLRNLVSNALKFTHSGGLVTLRCRDNGIKVEIDVMDTGVGIPPEDQEKLFKLDQSHTTTGTASEKGTGLGLLLCKELVETNEGQIWVESQPGIGTIFTFSLPKQESSTPSSSTHKASSTMA